MTDQLEEFLKQELAEEVEPDEVIETETDEETLEAETETAANEEAPAAPIEEPKREEEKPETMPMSAFMGIKSENKELKAQLQTLQQQSKPKEDVDIFEEPEKFKNNVISEAQQIALNSRFETSEMIMQDKHSDYDEKAEKFEQIVAKDPSLYNQLITSKNPAKFIYDHVVKTEKMSKFDNIEDHEAAIRAEEREKVLAEIAASNEGKKAEVPPSMVDVRSSTATKATKPGNFLDEIFPD